MPEYLFTAHSAKGRSVTEHVGARTIGDARRALEAQGFTDILFHTDDEQLRTNQRMQEQADPHGALRRVGARYASKTPQRPGNDWFMELVVMVGPVVVLVAAPLFLIGFVRSVRRDPFRWETWLAFIVEGAVGFVFGCGILALAGFRAQMRAATWNQVGMTRFWTAFIKRLPPIGRPPFFDLDLRLATVLARNGQVEEGRRLVAPYLAQAETDAMLLGRVGHFHQAAGESERALELIARAVEVSGNSTQALVDHAYFLARHLERPAEAQAVLDRLEGRELIEVVRVFVWFTRGLVALQQGRPADALMAFYDADRYLAPYNNVAIFKGMQLEIYAFRALAWAADGNVGEARRWFRKARPLLEARREVQLLARIRSAIPQAD